MTQNNHDMIKLLIADDEQEFASTLVARLELRNFKVSMVTSGMEALEALEKDLPDVMLLDLKMPDLDGLEVLARLRVKYPKLQVIILTGHGSFEAGKEGMELGAYDYIMKPVDLSRLIEIVQAAYEAK
ncbi:response regulator [Desulfosediminicola flagellatus]|uniref:response regulator n=1 Tax=Desulfosediminicola flagellatus TaxID=2569541 RepID=UPI001C3CC121|nr:response regulator [Desulfosediminicola flagellatus]